MPNCRIPPPGLGISTPRTGLRLVRCRRAALAMSSSLCVGDPGAQLVDGHPVDPRRSLVGLHPAVRLGSGSPVGKPAPSVVRSRLVLGLTPWTFVAPRAGQVGCRRRRPGRGAGPPRSLRSRRSVGRPGLAAAPRPSSRSRLLLGMKGSALRRPVPGLLWPRLTSPASSRLVAEAVVRIARTGSEISQGKL